LLGCIETLKAGKVIPDAQPEVFDQAPSIVRVDAGGGFSPLAFTPSHATIAPAGGHKPVLGTNPVAFG